MTLKIKLPLAVIAVVAGTALGVLLLATHSVRTQGEADIRRVREEKTAQVRQDLADKVNTVLTLIDAQYQEASQERWLVERYGQRLEAILDIAAATLQPYADRVRRGEITLEAAQGEALATLRAMRFDGGKGYIWINDTATPFPRMVMHPTLPELEGTVLDAPEFFCAGGENKNLFQEAVRLGRDEGGGFVGYLWPEPAPEGLLPGQAKLSHVRPFAPWGWILGTGIYVDEALREKVAETTEDLRKIRYGSDYFWINDVARPAPRMVMHPLRPELEGRSLELPEFEVPLHGGRKNLFSAFRDVGLGPEGEGFVEYPWPKRTAGGELGEPQPKLSFVKLYRPLGWVVGTGRHVDDIEAAIAEQAAGVEAQVSRLVRHITGLSLLILAGAMLAVSLVAGSITRPLARLARRTKEIAEDEQHLSRRLALRSRDEIGQLAEGFDQMAERLEQSFARMRAQRELLAGVLSSLPHAIFWKDRRGVYLGCNAGFAQLVGLPDPERIVGRRDTDLGWEPDEAQRLAEHERAVLDKGEPLLGLEEVFRDADGTRGRHLVSRVPLRDQGGNLIGLLGVLVELGPTDRELARPA